MAPRQRLAGLDRRLIEGIDAQQMRRKNRFQHEMHHESAEGLLVKPLQIDGAAGPPGLHKRVCNSGLLRRHEISGAAFREIVRAGLFGQPRVHTRPNAFALSTDDGDHVVARTVEIELQFRVLVDRPERGDGGYALAVLAPTLAGTLPIPAR